MQQRLFHFALQKHSKLPPRATKKVKKNIAKVYQNHSQAEKR